MPITRELIVPIVIGVMLILFNKPFAKMLISSQNMIGFKCGEKELKVSRIIIIICGICFIFIGLFALSLK